FQMQLLEADLHRPARMELQGEDPAARNGGVVQVHAGLAVDKSPYPAADRHHLVVVPVVPFDERLARLVPQHAAAVLLVELAPPAGPDVGLRPLDLAAGEGFAAELDAAVARVGDELDLHPQPEVAGQ